MVISSHHLSFRIGDGPLLPAPTSALRTSVSALLTLRPLFTPPLLCHLLTFQILSVTHHRLWVPTVFPSLVIPRDVNGSSNTRVYRTSTDHLNIKELHLHDSNFSLDAMPGTCPHLGLLYLCTGQQQPSRSQWLPIKCFSAHRKTATALLSVLVNLGAKLKEKPHSGCTLLMRRGGA